VHAVGIVPVAQAVPDYKREGRIVMGRSPLDGQSG
jgi:hypothetical protein